MTARKKLPPADDWIPSNRPRPTKAIHDSETYWEYIYRIHKEGKISYYKGEIFKHYDFRGKGSWMENPSKLGRMCPRGYVYVTMRFNGRIYHSLAHRVIYVMFNGPEVFNGGKVINHINGIKSDNRIENLELVTQTQNIRHALETGLKAVENTNTAKLNWETVKVIREKYSTGNYTQKQLADEYGVTQTTISSIVINKTWRETS